MRVCLLPFLFLPVPLAAETLQATAPIDRVTVFSESARVERVVSFSAEAGAHRIVIPGLPDGVSVTDMLFDLPAGVTLGAATLSMDRMPATDEVIPDAVKAARDEVDRLAEALAARDDAIAGLQSARTAAEAQLAYLGRLGSGDTVATPEDARAIGQMIAEEVAAAETKAIAARSGIRAAEKAREEDQKALDKAKRHLAAIALPEAGERVLTLDVETAQAGEHTLGIVTYAQDAGWAPVYDMYLSRGEAAGLHVRRGILVAQMTGEDWVDVDLTLSTARPGEEMQNQLPYPRLEAVETIEERDRRISAWDPAEAGMAEPVMEPEIVLEASRSGFGAVVTGDMAMVGDTVTYHYPSRVTLRDSADQVQLALDERDLTALVTARAVPRRDDTAFLMAEVTNDSGEVFLPGLARLYVDGAYRGQDDVPLIAVGDKAKIGFGAIDGIRLKRTVETRSEGDRGVISKSNQRDEAVVIEVRNLTAEDWPVTLYDTIPYSEQDDLTISYTADPAVAEANAEGRRGLLAWDLDLKAGETQTIRLEHSLSWPGGMVLK